jgi:hypothetical protein
MIVVQDEDYQAAIQKLQNSGFRPSSPKRGPDPQILQRLSDRQAVLEQINAGYRRLDRASMTFDYPDGEEQITLIPNSFAHLPFPFSSGNTANGYVTYGNMSYPCERALISSLILATLDEGDVSSSWAEVTGCWVSLMAGYLDVNDDIVDDFPDPRVTEWYSENFGRAYEAKNGRPFDRRVSKRLGSGKELAVDMRGRRLDSSP